MLLMQTNTGQTWAAQQVSEVCEELGRNWGGTWPPEGARGQSVLSGPGLG